jgi:hypothetical protein
MSSFIFRLHKSTLTYKPPFRIVNAHQRMFFSDKDNGDVQVIKDAMVVIAGGGSGKMASFQSDRKGLLEVNFTLFFGG